MKPRLIKFSCSACGARLAVPPEMAGVSDHCPKCGAMVTAPRPPPVEAPAQTAGQATTSGWNAAQLADALKPQRVTTAAAAPASTPVVQRELFPPMASVEPGKQRQVLGSILAKPEKDPGPAATQAPAAAPNHTALVHPPRDPQPKVHIKVPSALEPRAVLDPREREAVEMPGMGEVLAEGSAAASAERELGSKSMLHVPFLPVSDVKEEAKRARWRRLTIVGVVCFVVLDVAGALWLFRKPLQERFGSAAKSKNRDAVSDSAPAPSKVTGLGHARTGPAGGPGVEAPKSSKVAKPTQVPVAVPVAVTPAPEKTSAPPLATLPDGVLSASMTNAPPNVPTIAAPSDTQGAPQPLASVPLAIPLPGAASDNVPTAIPIPVPSKQPEIVAVTPPPTTPAATPEAAKVENPLTQPVGAEVPAPPPMPSSATGPAKEPSGAAMQSASLTLEPLPAIPATPTEPRIGKVPVEAKGALQVLRKFLDAPSWEQRVPLSLKGDALRGAMEKHAASFGDGPVQVGSISFVERYPSKNGVPPYCMFEVSDGSLSHPVMVLVEETPKSGIRVDWEAFVDFKDNLLLRFLNDHSLPAQKFRVMLQRHHYFEDDVPDVDGKDSFKAIQPNADFMANVFLPKGSATARQLSSKLTWGEDIPVIAELVWRTDGKLHWVEIASIVSYGWRG